MAADENNGNQGHQASQDCTHGHGFDPAQQRRRR
jgi:hypothetical protein